MSAYFNITEIEIVAIASLRVQRRLAGVEMTKVEAHMASYSLIVCYRSQSTGSTNFDHDGLSGRFRTTVRAMPKRHLWVSEIQLMS